MELSVISTVIGTIISFCGLIYLAYTAKKMQSTVFWIEKIEEIMDEIHSNKDIQAKMYDIGAFMGSAIAHGTGLKGSKKGGLMETVGQLFGLYQQITKPKEQQQGEASFGQTS